MADNVDSCSVEPAIQQPSRLLRFLDWLQWQRLLLLSLAAGIVVGGYVFLMVPVRFSARASVLLSEQPDIATSLGLLAASGVAPRVTLGAFNLNGTGALQRLQATLTSTSLRAELLKRHHLVQVPGLTEGGAMRWLNSATKIQTLGTGLVPGVGGLGGVGLAVQVTCPSTSRIRSWLGAPRPFTPRQAKELCAALADDYLVLLDQYMTRLNVETARDARVFVEQRKQEAEAKLKGTEDRLLTLQSHYQLVEPGSKVSQLLDLMKGATQAQTQAAAEVDSATRALEVARRRLTTEQADRISEEITLRNPVLIDLEEKLAQLRLDLAAALASGKSAEHPDVVALRSAVRSAEEQRSAVAQEVRQQLTVGPNPVYDATAGKVADLEVSLAGARARQARYGAILARWEAEAEQLPPMARQYTRLSRERDMQSDLLVTLSKRLEMAIIQEQAETSGRFQVLDTAVPPEKKSGPSSVRSALGAFLFVALLLAAGWAWRRGVFVITDD